MIWFALLPALMTQPPTVVMPSSQQLYERPLVRPFEPASTFGREQAQGDDESDAWRKPLMAPVSVDAYRHSYEVSPTDAQVAYEQAVAQRELDYDGRMGPLDGRWAVKDSVGRPMLSLVLFDDGGDRPVEGAWARQARPGAAGELEPVDAVRRDGLGPVGLSLGAAGALMLSPAGDDHWVGLLTDGRGTHAIVLERST